jgi:hypothetical protein
MLLSSNFHAADRRAESFRYMAGPWPRLETFISAPLVIGNVGDIRLADIAVTIGRRGTRRAGN